MSCSSTCSSMQDHGGVERVFQKVRRILGCTNLDDHCLECLHRLMIGISAFQCDPPSLILGEVTREWIIEGCLCCDEHPPCIFKASVTSHVADALWIGSIQYQHLSQTKSSSMLNGH